MVAVDTSVWIDYFRGREAVVKQLHELLEEDGIILPVPIWIELLSGASKQDAQLLRTTLSALPRVSPTKMAWKTMENWVSVAARKGRRFGFADLLIAATCAEAGARLWSLDRDFAEMAALKFIKLY